MVASAATNTISRFIETFSMCTKLGWPCVWPILHTGLRLATALVVCGQSVEAFKMRASQQVFWAKQLTSKHCYLTQ